MNYERERVQLESTRLLNYISFFDLNTWQENEDFKSEMEPRNERFLKEYYSDFDYIDYKLRFKLQAIVIYGETIADERNIDFRLIAQTLDEEKFIVANYRFGQNDSEYERADNLMGKISDNVEERKEKTLEKRKEKIKDDLDQSMDLILNPSAD